MTQRIAIKIGSNVLTRKDGSLNITRISSIVDQIAFLLDKGYELILISSGAVAAGRSECPKNSTKSEVERRQLFSAIGQTKLMNHYYELFHEYNILVGQVLTTKESFSTRHHYLTQRNCIEVMLRNKVLPIINENDTVAVTELMFTDNDELSGLIATMMGCQSLILLSNVGGIYTTTPDNPEAELLSTVYPKDKIHQYIYSSKSSFGRGGMLTKALMAQKLAKEGVAVFIANGHKEKILIHLLEAPEKEQATHFIASDKQPSGVKRWLAHSEDFAKGKVFINEEAEKLLTQERALSLLPIGITQIVGSFKKGDLIEIYNSQKNLIGLGKAQYHSEMATTKIGKKGEKAFIHYNYLCLF